MIGNRKFETKSRANKIGKNTEDLNKELKQKNKHLYNMLKASDKKVHEEEKNTYNVHYLGIFISKSSILSRMSLI